MRKPPVRSFRYFVASSCLGALVAAGPVLAAPAAKTPAWYWTTAKAAATVKANYATVDTVRLAWAIRRGEQFQIDRAKTSARPDRVTCAGVGKGTRFFKFHCTAHVIGTQEWATDGFQATKKVTVKVYPSGKFAILEGWR